MYSLMHALLPQFVQQSRKGLIWFLGLSGAGLAEIVKNLGTLFRWTPVQTEYWSHEALLFQAALLAVSALWTQQIAKEDAALKTGLPPPAPIAPTPSRGRVTP